MENFFGSKLNTVLLLVLIVLMGFVIKLMLANKELYLHPLSQTSHEVYGDKEDLLSFSVVPGQKVSGIVNTHGSVKNNYFFEGNIIVNILDEDAKLLKQGHGNSTTDWMKVGPVSFEASLDFTGLPKGPAYIEIKNDNPSGITINDKAILIPVVIE